MSAWRLMCVSCLLSVACVLAAPELEFDRARFERVQRTYADLIHWRLDHPPHDRPLTDLADVIEDLVAADAPEFDRHVEPLLDLMVANLDQLDDDPFMRGLYALLRASDAVAATHPEQAATLHEAAMSRLMERVRNPEGDVVRKWALAEVVEALASALPRPEMLPVLDAVAEWDDPPDVRWERARVLATAGRFEEAWEVLLPALQAMRAINPKLLDGLFDEHPGLWTEERLAALLELGAPCQPILLALARAAADRGDAAQAAELLEEILRDPWAHYGAGSFSYERQAFLVLLGIDREGTLARVRDDEQLYAWARLGVALAIADEEPGLAVLLASRTPDEQWICGGETNDLGGALLALAAELGDSHPDLAEDLLREVQDAQMFLVHGQYFGAMANLPRDRAREHLIRWVDAFRDGWYWEWGDAPGDMLDRLAAVDPGLVQRMCDIWLEQAIESEDGPVALARETSTTVAAMASREVGLGILAATVERGNEDEWLDVFQFVPTAQGPIDPAWYRVRMLLGWWRALDTVLAGAD